MTRVNTSVSKRKAHKKILKSNKGYVGSHSRLFRVANQQQMKSIYYSYFGRKKQKRNLKSLWIKQINIASRRLNKNYNKIICYLKNNKVCLNKKILAKLCVHDIHVFSLLLGN